MAEQCTAKAQTTGERCKRQPTPGRTVCWIHGGASLSGIAHPRWKHGKRSKYLGQLPARLRSAVEDIRSGTANYLTLREEMELVDVQILGALDSLYGAEPWTVHWKSAQQALRKFLAASRHRQADLAEAALAEAALAELAEAIEGGYRTELGMLRLQRFIDTRRKLASTEGRNLERAAKVLTAGELLTLVQQLNFATKELVGGILGAISTAHGLDRHELEVLTRPALKTWVEEIRQKATPATAPLPPSPADQPSDPLVH